MFEFRHFLCLYCMRDAESQQHSPSRYTLCQCTIVTVFQRTVGRSISREETNAIFVLVRRPLWPPQLVIVCCSFARPSPSLFLSFFSIFFDHFIRSISISVSYIRFNLVGRDRDYWYRLLILHHSISSYYHPSSSFIILINRHETEVNATSEKQA